MINSFFLQISNLDSTSISTIMIAIGTMILAGVTAYYAFQTRKTVDVMEKSAELSIMPHLKGHMITESAYGIYFRITNVGKGPANDIMFSFWLDTHPNVVKKWSNNVLMPNDYKDFLLINPDNNSVMGLDDFRNTSRKIRMQSLYYDIRKTAYNIDETIDVTEFVKNWVDSNQKIEYNPLENLENHCHLFYWIM